MTLEEQEKYKRMSEMMKQIKQPGVNATAFMGNTLSKVKKSLNDLGTTYTNPSFGVEKPKIYNNPNLKNTVPVGNLLLKSTLHKGTSPFANITNSDHKATQGKFGSKLFETDL